MSNWQLTQELHRRVTTPLIEFSFTANELILDCIALLQELDDRITSFEQSEERPIANSQILNDLGVFYAHRGNIPHAVTTLREAVDREEIDLDACRNLAEIYEISGQIDEAAEIWDMLTFAYPEDEEALERFLQASAQVWREKTQNQEELIDIITSKTFRPVFEHPAVLHRLGLIKQPSLVFPVNSEGVPAPDLEEVAQDRARIFGPAPVTLPGIDLRADIQREFLEKLLAQHDSLPYSLASIDITKGAVDQPFDLRYRYDNPSYYWADGALTYAFLAAETPKKILQIGANWATTLLLDLNQRDANGEIALTLLDARAKEEVHTALETQANSKELTLHTTRLQDADPSLFTELEAGDVLFVSSSHAAKTGSDVNCLLFEVLPLLAPGTRVYLHGIFYPFEYPETWITDGICWNEAYLLRAFLQYNQSFVIDLFTDFALQTRSAELAGSFPAFYTERSSGIWLRRV